MTRVVGAIVFLVGLALLALAGILVSAQFQAVGRVEPGAGGFIAVLVLITWFCLNAGLRFLLNKPSPDNSILFQSGWRALGVAAAAITAWFVVLALPDVGRVALALAFGGTVTTLSWRRAATFDLGARRDADL